VATNLAELENSTGDAGAALLMGRQALDRHKTLGNQRVAALCSCNVATYLIALGRNQEGVVAAFDAVNAAVEVRDTVLALWALQHMAAAIAFYSHVDNQSNVAELLFAARLLAFVDARLNELSIHRDRSEEQEYTRAMAATRGIVSTTALDACVAEGASWTLARAVAEALHRKP
jgi:hypothetical protein